MMNNNLKMYVYSGKCRQGECGKNTSLKDVNGDSLFVGDIVITSTIDGNGICSNNELTVVVSDKYTTYSNGIHKSKENDIIYFVMGIKNVDFMGKDKEEWIVKKVKSFSDVIDGEHWREYGFNYKQEQKQ